MRAYIIKTVWFWSGLLALGIMAGIKIYPVLYIFLPSLKNLQAAAQMSNQGPFQFDWYWVLIIFGKNTFVALSCIVLAGLTRGLFPALVCTVNGAVLGAGYVLFSVLGSDTPLQYIGSLVPHGVLEFTAILICCSIGMYPSGWRDKLAYCKIPLIMLAIAATTETWITPYIMNTWLY